MNLFRRVSIASRLIVGFCALFALLLTLSSLQYLGLQGISTTMHEVVEERQPRALGIKTLSATLRDAASQIGFYSATLEPSLAERFESLISESNKQIEAVQLLVGADAHAMSALGEISRKVARFHQLGRHIIALGKDQEANYPGVSYANSHVNPLTRRMVQQAEGMVRSEVADGDADAMQAQRIATYSDLRNGISNLMRGLRGYLAFRGDSQKANTLAYLEQLEKILQDVGSWSDEYTFEQEEYAAGLTTDVGQLRGHMDRMFDLHGSDEWRQDSWLLRRDVLPLLSQTEQLLDGLVASEENGIQEASSELLRGADATTRFSMWVTLGGLILGVISGWFLLRSIARPIRAASTAMAQVADGDGDLTHRLPEDGSDEISRLARAFNGFVAYVESIVRQTAKTTGIVIAGVASTNDAMGVIAGKIEHQQRETDQVATAVTEMSASAAEVARSASNADQSAREALAEAQNGRQIVGGTMAGINTLAERLTGAAELVQRLDADAQAISSVVDVIRSIAEQTNLLALNAAIEAARAGESGRGFAVVADEVRTLANRTHASTVEIEDMIHRLATSAGDAVSIVNTGSEMAASNAGQAETAIAALSAIESAVGKISGLNAQIATAAEEQRAVADDVHRAVAAVSQVGRDSSHEAEKARDTAVQLGDRVAELQSLVGRFKLGIDALDFEKAKSAHLAWRARVRNFLDGKGSLQRHEVVSHHECELGKWYYGDGLAKFGDLDEMKSLELPHQRLHALIGEIIECKQKDDKPGAETRFGELATLSEEIVTNLDRLERSVESADAHGV